MSDDLVARLLDLNVKHTYQIRQEAADRIEADHRLIVQKQQHVKEQETELVELRCTGGDLRRRIEELEAIIGENVAHDGQSMRERVTALEAALRTCAEYRGTSTRGSLNGLQTICRRALEGKS